MFHRIAAFASCWLLAGFSVAEDWPQWRGVNRDAVLSDERIPASIAEGTVTLQWRTAIGPGYSGPTVADRYVYVTDRGPNDAKTEIERVLCLDAQGGDLVWKHEYPAPYSIGYRAGPRASVTVHEGAAYSIGAMGHFVCLDAATGAVRWNRDLNEQYAIDMPIWGITASPLVYRDLVIQIVGGRDAACVVAFDRASGQERWRALGDRAGYSSPILMQQGGQDVVVCWTGDSVSGLDPMTGKVFWRVAMKPRNMPIGVPTPVVQGDKLFVSSFYDGSLLIQIDPNRPAAKQVWRRIGIDEKNTDALHCMISTPLIKGNHIYGTDSYGELRCLKLENGDRVWEDLTVVPRNRWATIHTFQIGDREILFNDQGELIFGRLSPEGFEVASRSTLLDRTTKQLNRRGGVTWAHPAIANGIIYARNDNEIVAASLMESAAR
ncbi:MAG: PQQ-binding-like beta-propeller repeat protein [Planctomycetota bacterium]